MVVHRKHAPAVHAPRVALLIETSNAYGRGLLSGVAQYVQEAGPWSIYLPEAGRAETIGHRLRNWRGDGVLMRAEDPSAARVARASKAAVVDLSAAGRLANAPAVHSDARAEATMAFEHLFDRGFRHLAFCGVSDYRWVLWQQERLIELAKARQLQIDSHVTSLRSTQASGGSADRRALVAWLMRLPKPVGIFACHDLRGQQVLEACRAAGFRIPDEVAVLGVDDDAVRCSLSNPPLSSVAPNTRQIGYTAAQLLDQMMSGKRVAPGMRFIQPLGITARRSTDALVVDDPDVSAALRFIRQHATEPITISDILDQVALSRRSLESRFVRSIGRTPHQEIIRCRLEIAKQLLRDTDLPIKAIAPRAGASSPEYLSVLFQRTLGCTPSMYRERLR